MLTKVSVGSPGLCMLRCAALRGGPSQREQQCLQQVHDMLSGLSTVGLDHCGCRGRRLADGDLRAAGRRYG